jgi:branched-chain amino acid aminotransferase
MLRFDENSILTKEFVIDKVIELIRANNLKEDSYIKIGLFLDDEKGWSSTEPTSLFILAYPKGRVFEDRDGLACSVSSWQRINDAAFPPRIKAASNYINSRLAMLEAKTNGYDYTFILNNRSTVAEGPGACVFMVREGKLILPPVYSSILESITSDTVVDIAKNLLGIEIIEREIDRTELYIADEIFMAGTMIEIKPVISVDGLQIKGKTMGEISRRITSEYYNIVYNRNEAYGRWLTPVYNSEE